MKKSKGRYQNKDRRVIDREYMSYEDVPLQDYRDAEPVPKNLTKKFLRVFLILFLSVVLVLALMNANSLTPDNISHWFQYDLLGKTEGDGFPVEFNGTTVNNSNFDIIDNAPIYCSDTSITTLNTNGGIYQETQHSFANPIMNVSGSYAMIYNVNATGYKIVNRESTVHSASANDKLFCADIAYNGIYAILTHGDDYLSRLTVYRRDNLERYTYAFADYYVNRVSLNRDGSRGVVSGVSAKNGGLISVIYILDFSQNNYLQKYEVEDNCIYDVKYLDNGNAVAIGQNAAYFINVNDNKKTDISYGSRQLTTYSFVKSYGMLLSLSANPDGRSCDIVMINADGKKESEIKTQKEILSMDYRNGRIACMFPTSSVIYDIEGKQLATVKTATDARKLRFWSDDTLYVLGKSKIAQMHIKY